MFSLAAHSSVMTRPAVLGGGRVARSARPMRAVRMCAGTSSTSAPELTALEDKSAYEAAHAFQSYANWIIPGQVMLGRYPFVEPSRCKSRDKGEAQLMDILKQGITVFTCLQDELSPQEKMPLRGENGFLPYKPTADIINASLQPPPPSEINDGLRNPTLDQFLPTRRSSRSYTWDKKDLTYTHAPIVDLGTPSIDVLSDLVDDIETKIQAGEKVYLHCWGGRGRAGTVGAALLAKMYGISAEEALERVQAAYDTRMDAQRKSPETDEQLACVATYVDSL